MDKYEYKVRADEIRDLISQGQYSQAAELADTIDWSRVKKTAILCTISDLYKKNRRYDDAIELLQLAYEKNPGGKDILYSLCELYIKTNNIINTVATYKDFLKIASNDPRRYILQYKIYEMEDVTLEERIEVLEELKSRDYREKWAYTLAYLYHRAGLATKCVEECDELILWFDEGKYVYMAMELKMRHQPLTPAQQEKYDHRFDAINGVGWQSQLPTDDVASPVTDDTGELANAEQNYTAPVPAAPVSDMEAAALAGQTIVYNPVQDVTGESVMVPDGNTVVMGNSRGAVTSAEAIALSMGYTQVYHGMEPEPEIQVKPVDVGEYNTINLQQALAEGVAEVLEKNPGEASSVESIFKADTKEIYPAADSDTKEIPSIPEGVDYTPQAVTDKTVVIAKVSGTFDATKTIPLHDIQKSIKDMEANKSEASSEAAPIPVPGAEEVKAENKSAEVSKAAPVATPDTAVYTGNTVPLYNNDLINSIRMPGSNVGTTKVIYPTQEAMSIAETEAMSAQPPEKYAEVMTQEPDGQLSLVMPEDKVKLVSQITGQLSINDVMTEWNRLKYEREELNRKRYHELVKQQTGEIFNEFERAALNGVLETLEKESADAARAKEEAERKAEEERIAAATDGPVQKLAFERVDMKKANEAIDGEAIMTSREVAGAAGAVASVAAVAAEATVADIAVEAGASVVESLDILDDTRNVADEAISEVATEVVEEATEAITEAVAEEIVEESAEESVEEIAEEPIEEIVEEIAKEPAKKEMTFEESLGSIFDNIDNEPEEKEIDSDIWDEKSEDSEDEYFVEEASEEDSEVLEEIFAEESGEEIIDEESTDENIKDENVDGENVDGGEENSDETSEEASEEYENEEEVDPRDKTYHVIGMNETTNHYINKKKKKLEAKAAEKDSENTDSSDEDSDDDVRELTPEEQELFGPYINGKESRKQLINLIDNVSMASYTGNIILTGGDGTDVSDLATVIMKDIKQTDSNFSGKVARVPAKSLNNKKMDAVIKQLANGALIIENASAMSDNTAAGLYKCLDTENLGIIITLLDSERNMEKLLSRAPRLSPLFTARMNVKPLTKEQLAEFAVKYAYEQEYSIDQMGMLGLHRMIEARQTATHSVNLVEIKEIVDQAIAHVSKKSIGHFFDILGGKRYDSEDMIILGEKDFR